MVPPKHQWTYDEVKKILGDRLGLIHTSSTRAFMKAKRSTSQTMSVADLKRMLMNLNIDVSDCARYFVRCLHRFAVCFVVCARHLTSRRLWDCLCSLPTTSFAVSTGRLIRTVTERCEGPAIDPATDPVCQ